MWPSVQESVSTSHNTDSRPCPSTGISLENSGSVSFSDSSSDGEGYQVAGLDVATANTFVRAVRHTLLREDANEN